MRAAFPKLKTDETSGPDDIYLKVKGGNDQPEFDCSVTALFRPDDKSFLSWFVNPPINKGEVEEALKEPLFLSEVEKSFKEFLETNPAFPQDNTKALRELFPQVQLQLKKQRLLGEVAVKLALSDYVIYAPESSALRAFEKEGALQPIGANGEGLLKLIQSFADPKLTDPNLSNRLADLKARLHLFGWFDDFLGPNDVAMTQAKLQIRDRYLAPEHPTFDQRSANEGFLYVLFYFALLMSWRTPRFFAIDNVDNALNPKLCAELMKQIAKLAKKYDKQVICTTHNPAILDGLNLNDDEQRIYTVQRDSEGHTVVNRVHTPQVQPGEFPMKLSAAFLAGYIGGLPEHF